MYLYLSIRDLSDRGCGGVDLDLAIGNLRDRCSRRMDLDLTITDLGDGCSGGVYLDLAIRDLRNWCSGRMDLDLSITDLGDGGHNLNRCLELDLAITCLLNGNEGG